MGFNKFFVSADHALPENIRESAKRFLKADAVIGDAQAIDAINEFIRNSTV